MVQSLRQILAAALHLANGALGPRALAVLGALAAVNVAVWVLALAVFHGNGALLLTALMAWKFGLRHAVDADHIAAIDNVTRKLTRHGSRPLLVGFWFSLGHATIVFALACVVALATAGIQARFPGWRETGGVIGTSVSASFLFLIAIINVGLLRDIVRAYRAARRGDLAAAQAMDAATVQGGVIARVTRPLFRLVTRSWHMYPLGVLFGLGFDTATEISLLGISATQATAGLPVWAILVFPALFTAGMSLVDTADGILMQGAYGWADVQPLRRLTYNLVITALSVAVAVLIGAVEVLGLIGDRGKLTGGFWDAIGTITGDQVFGWIGGGVIAAFVIAWAVSAVRARSTPVVAPADLG